MFFGEAELLVLVKGLMLVHALRRITLDSISA